MLWCGDTGFGDDVLGGLHLFLFSLQICSLAFVYCSRLKQGLRYLKTFSEGQEQSTTATTLPMHNIELLSMTL